jgi:hypothetical protein
MCGMGSSWPLRQTPRTHELTTVTSMYIGLSHGRPSVTQVHVHARMAILARRELRVNKLHLSVSMYFPARNAYTFLVRAHWVDLKDIRSVLDL